MTKLGESLDELINQYTGKVQPLIQAQKNISNDLEDLFKQILINKNFHENKTIDPKKFRKQLQNPLEKDFIKNQTGENWFIEQPFGSQQFPDFLVGDNNYIVAVELKSKKSTGLPIMNGHLIGLSDVLVFANSEDKKIGYFRGNIIHNKEDIELLLKEVDEIKSLEKNLDKSKNQIFSIRRAWNWNKSVKPIYELANKNLIQDKLKKDLEN